MMELRDLKQKADACYVHFLPEEDAISLSFYSALAPVHQALK